VAIKAGNKELPLNIWEKVELVVGDDEHQGIYVTKVEDFNSEGIIITHPTLVGGNKLLTANATVYVQFRRADAMYRFSARMKPLNGSSHGDMQLYELGGIQRVQRRQYVRIDYKLELKYAMIKNESGFNNELRWHNSQTKNMSAGGLLMKISGEIKKDDIMLVRIEENSRLGIPGLVAVINRRFMRDEDDIIFAGVEFITSDELSMFFTAEEIKRIPSQVQKFTAQVQNKLIRFIFDEQIRERQKGLI
jgi:c-di-GMP-binding flagellar brake protein YcgR